MDALPNALNKFILKNARKPPIVPQVKIISELETFGGQNYTRHRGIAIGQVMPDACIYISMDDLVGGRVPLKSMDYGKQKLYVIKSEGNEQKQIMEEDITKLAAAVSGIQEENANCGLNLDEIFAIQSLGNMANTTNVVTSSYGGHEEKNEHDKAGIFSNAHVISTTISQSNNTTKLPEDPRNSFRLHDIGNINEKREEINAASQQVKKKRKYNKRRNSD